MLWEGLFLLPQGSLWEDVRVPVVILGGQSHLSFRWWRPAYTGSFP